MRRCIQLACLCWFRLSSVLQLQGSRKFNVDGKKVHLVSWIAKLIWILWVVVSITLLVSSPQICCCSRFPTDVGHIELCSTSIDKESNPFADAEEKFCKISWGAELLICVQYIWCICGLSVLHEMYKLQNYKLDLIVLCYVSCKANSRCKFYIHM